MINILKGRVKTAGRGAAVIAVLLVTMNTSYGTEGGADSFEGYWKMKDGNFILDIQREGDGVYSGRVVWLKNPKFPEGDRDEGRIQVDRNNPNPELRMRPVMGLEIVDDLRLEEGRLRGGWVYDSWHGRFYYGSARLEDENLLKLRGSVDRYGILGHTMKAYRVEESDYNKYGLESQESPL